MIFLVHGVRPFCHFLWVYLAWGVSGWGGKKLDCNVAHVFFLSFEKGYGLFARQSIPEGSFLLFYRGNEMSLEDGFSAFSRYVGPAFFYFLDDTWWVYTLFLGLAFFLFINGCRVCQAEHQIWKRFFFHDHQKGMKYLYILKKHQKNVATLTYMH